MTEPATATERPARRFLHICYCCADAAEVTDFFVDGLAMRNTMRTPDQYNDGSVLGMDRMVRSVASFVYDHRGPRVSPAIEINSWIDPPLVGEPSTDPFEVGLKALGFAVPSLDAAIERLTDLGCTLVADAGSPTAGRHVTVLDPRQVTLDLVEDPALGEGETRMRHLRVTVADLDESLPFYDRLGFDLLDRVPVAGAAWVGGPAEAEGELARLRLPDEPFEVHLVQWASPAGHGRHYVEPNHAGLFRAAVGVDDTRASYEGMSARGVAFDRPPQQVELAGTPVPDMWITFISDPNGIAYEFVQRPRSAFR